MASTEYMTFWMKSGNSITVEVTEWKIGRNQMTDEITSYEISYPHGYRGPRMVKTVLSQIEAVTVSEKRP